MKTFQQFLNDQNSIHPVTRIHYNLENNRTSIHFPTTEDGAIKPGSREVIGNTMFADGTAQGRGNLDFSQALALLKAGHRLTRNETSEGEVGIGSWICLSQGSPTIKPEQFWNEHSRDFAIANGGSAELIQYFLLKTEDGKIQMGWSPSQRDILATDWYVVK